MGSLCSTSPTNLLSKSEAISKIVRSRNPSLIGEPPNIRDFYKLGRIIGSGQFSKVRKATSLKDQSFTVAVKSIPRRRLKSPSSLLREIELLRSLDHPNIVKIYEVFEDIEEYHIVMELCTGRELIDCLSDLGHFDERTAGKLFRKILTIVNYLHKSSVCHRDLKLENFVGVVTQHEIEIKLVDFGLSRKFGKEKKSMRTVVGTMYYVAPEVLGGKYDEKCDMWSCGVILYLLLSGKMPFGGWDEEELTDAICKAPVEFPCSDWGLISQPAKDLLEGLLSRNVNKRLSAEDALKHSWFNESPGVEIDLDVVRSLKSFKLRNCFQKEVLLLLAKTADSGQVRELNEVFFALDTQKVGFLTEEEIGNGLCKAGMNTVKSELRMCLENLDLDKDGRINYSDFLVAALNYRFVLDEGNIRDAFSHFDQGTGKIGKEQLKEVLIMNNSSVDDCDKILDDLNLKNKGEISYEEFKEIFLNY